MSVFCRPQNVLCLGRRRTGKTTVINCLKNTEPEPLTIVVSDFIENEYNVPEIFRHTSTSANSMRLIGKIFHRQSALSAPPFIDLILDDVMLNIQRKHLHKLLNEGTERGISTFYVITYPSDSSHDVPCNDEQERLFSGNKLDLIILCGPQFPEHLRYLYNKYCSQIPINFDQFNRNYHDCLEQRKSFVIDNKQGVILSM
jgi:hypothetical protein